MPRYPNRYRDSYIFRAERIIVSGDSAGGGLAVLEQIFTGFDGVVQRVSEMGAG